MLICRLYQLNIKFTFADKPGLSAPARLVPPLYHSFSKSDSSNPEMFDCKKKQGNHSISNDLDLLWRDAEVVGQRGNLQVARFTTFLDPGENAARKLGKVVH